MVGRENLVGGEQSGSMDYAIWPGWQLLMQDAGLATEPVLRRAGLPLDLFAQENVRLAPRGFFELWTALEAEARSLDPSLPCPLRIARVMSADWFDPELFAALCSSNLLCALERLAKYVRLIAPLAFRIDRTEKHTTLRIDFLERAVPVPSVFLAFKLVFFVGLARHATRTHVRPVRVSWPLQSISAPDRQAYSDYFGVPVEETPLATLVFDAVDVERPFLTANHKMWSFFEPALRQRLVDLDRTANMSMRVRSVLLEALPAGEVSMHAVSRRLGVSTRTLQRRLQEEGATFQQTLDALRSSLADHYLRTSAMSSAEIAWLLGFEDANSFVRAFRAWTGKTPQVVRRDHRGGLGEASGRSAQLGQGQDERVE